MPAYRKLLVFIRDEYIPKARTTIAAQDLPDGDAFYRAQIREYTTTDMSPEEIHQLGPKEVARIDAEMRKTMAEPASKARFADFLNFLKTDPQFYAKTPDELMGVSAYVPKRVDGKVGKLIGTLPRRRFGLGQSRTRSRPSTRRAAAGRLHDEHLRFADTAALQHPGADASRMRARPQPADRDPAGAEGAAGIPQIRLFLGHRRGLGPLLRMARQRDGDLPHALRAVRPAELRDVARRAAGDRHRHPPLRLVAPARRSTISPATPRFAARGRDRGRPLHQLARAGARPTSWAS